MPKKSPHFNQPIQEPFEIRQQLNIQFVTPPHFDPLHDDSQQHFLFLQRSTAENLVQPAVFPLLNLDLPAQLFSILEPGLQLIQLLSGFVDFHLCSWQKFLKKRYPEGALSADRPGYLAAQSLPVPLLLG